MLVAVSGSQGCGKSSVLEQIEKINGNVIKRKSSRSILSDWGISLAEINNDQLLTMKFQDEITKRKFEDEQEAIASNDIWFTERTHADLFTYALATLGCNNAHSDWVNSYYNRCFSYNQSYAAVYYIQGGSFSVVHDGTRGTNSHYSKLIDLTMLDVTKQMIHGSKLQVITTADLQVRANMISEQSYSFYNKINITKEA